MKKAWSTFVSIDMHYCAFLICSMMLNNLLQFDRAVDHICIHGGILTLLSECIWINTTSIGHRLIWNWNKLLNRLPTESVKQLDEISAKRIFSIIFENWLGNIFGICPISCQINPWYGRLGNLLDSNVIQFAERTFCRKCYADQLALRWNKSPNGFSLEYIRWVVEHKG